SLGNSLLSIPNVGDLPEEITIKEDLISTPNHLKITGENPGAFSSDLEIKIENIEEISCYGKSDGSIAISVSGGAGQYSFLWKMEAGSFSATSQDISSLEKGNYILEVTDANFH